MNFFKRKRDPNDQEQIDAERGRDTKRPRNIVSLIKKAGDSVKQKITVAFKALTTRTYRHDVKSFLFTTPAGPLRSSRYIMTPSQPFSAAKSSLEWRNHSYYVLDSTINVTESHHHEFKTGGGSYPITILPEHIQKYGSAFLNTDGGVLIAGVLDNGAVRGVYCSPRMQTNIRNTVSQEFEKFIPYVDHSLYKIKFVPVIYQPTPRERREGRYIYVADVFVIEISVKAGVKGELYETRKNQVFIRRESSVQGPLNPLQIKDIVISKYREVIELRRMEAALAKNQEPTSKQNFRQNRNVIVVSP